MAFPDLEAASFFSSSLVTEKEGFDFLSLYIPSNPMYALSHNIVPALVLFSIVLGRWSAARHYGGAIQDEIGAVGYAFYRIVIGNPARLLGLTARELRLTLGRAVPGCVSCGVPCRLLSLTA